MPILRSYAPGLLAQCVDQQDLAKRTVSEWLRRYMFKGQDSAETKANEIGAYFANYNYFKSHGRPVRIEQLRQMGLRVSALEDDQQLQDAVLSVHHATMHTFSGTPAAKVVENHLGNAFVRLSGLLALSVQPDQGVPARPSATPMLPMNRAQRRAANRSTKGA